ncbi:MAG: LytTR family DNA-binding domain-containing protein [Cyclobacteriaceae bacterium]
MINAKSESSRFLVFSSIFLLIIYILLMIQNVIRYVHHDSYDPFIAIWYFAISFSTFLLVIPVFYRVEKRLFVKGVNPFFLLSGILTVLTILVYFLLSNLGLMLASYFDGFPSEVYARRYFGRDVLFHFIILGTAVYQIKNQEKKKGSLISGSLGRKEITIQSSLVSWIEADDHYLKIHTPENSIMKRTTLEKMAEDLKPDFVRIHRKYLVNKEHIIGKEKQQRDEYVILKSGTRLKIGRSYGPLNL